MGAYKLSWLPDRSQPLLAGQSSHNDVTMATGLSRVQAVAGALPNLIVPSGGILDLRPFCPPIDNQGQVGECVADSTTAGLEFTQIRSGMPFVKKSRLFLYYNARLQTQTTDKDDGTYIRLAFSTLTSLGTCTEATWPYDPTTVFQRPSWAAYREAIANKIVSYFAIDPTAIANGGQGLVDAIKQPLLANHPVVFGMTVDQDYMATGSDGLVAMPQANRVGGGGGHAQLIVGYNDNTQRWIVRNSWGTGWGDGGYCYVPYAYLDASDANDLWVPYVGA